MNAVTARTSTLAVVSLVTGILAWVCLPFVGARVAVLGGQAPRSELRAPPPAMQGDGLAVAGLVLGWLQLAMLVMAVLVVFAFFGGLAFFMHLAS
jgi:hypothetical protein